MNNKPIRAPKGFLTPRQVSKRARKIGFIIDPKRLSLFAHEKRVPFVVKVKGMGKVIRFPESKIMEVISAAPKKAIYPKGSVTEYGLKKLAGSKGLRLHMNDIHLTIKRIEAGKEQLEKGLARDLFHKKHPYIIPGKLANRMIEKAQYGKNAKILVKTGELVPVAVLAGNLGLKSKTVRGMKELQKITVRGKVYVTASEAQRFTAWYWRKKIILSGAKGTPVSEPSYATA